MRQLNNFTQNSQQYLQKQIEQLEAVIQEKKKKIKEQQKAIKDLRYKYNNNLKDIEKHQQDKNTLDITLINTMSALNLEIKEKKII